MKIYKERAIYFIEKYFDNILDDKECERNKDNFIGFCEKYKWTKLLLRKRK